mmetsp:Transcript_47911/g.95310  ORF Transcript_47911/g.95310 Transcript_47911/m.95310 type:complete len:288 (+) Transcript_47911:53-916(+)
MSEGHDAASPGQEKHAHPGEHMNKIAVGLAAVAICIGLGPFAVTAIHSYVGPAKLHRLPSTATASQVAAALKSCGVVVIENRVGADIVAKAYAELVAGRFKDANVRFGYATRLLKNPLHPVNESAVKVLLEDPVVLDAAEQARLVHGEGSARMVPWEVRLLILSPGTPFSEFHRDVVDTTKPPLQRPLQWGLNAIWAVDNFTVQNGATRFVPGSHSARWPQGSWTGDHDILETLAESAEMPTGSVVLYYASVLHGTGQNSASAKRTGLNFNYAFVDEAGGRPAGWGW